MNEIVVNYIKHKIDDNEAKILGLFTSKREITRSDVEEALGLTKYTAIRILRSLLDKGKIEVIGIGKSTRYVLNDEKEWSYEM